jgi:hypothetical protein
LPLSEFGFSKQKKEKKKMATKWSGFFGYKAKHKDIDSVLKGSFIPVKAFSVKGGAKRLIDLASTDDLSLVSEFEQARNFKNISLYLPPAKNFEWLDLTEISIHHLPVSMFFFASGNIGQTVIHQFTLACKIAEITDSPSKTTDGGIKNIVLKVSMSLPETQLIHGSFQGSEFVEETW